MTTGSNTDPAADAWTTLTVTRMTGWTNLYRFEGARGGVIAQPAPAVLLQQHDDGRRRSVFAVANGAELVPADGWTGYVATVRASSWDVYHGLDRLDVLLARETGAPLP